MYQTLVVVLAGVLVAGMSYVRIVTRAIRVAIDVPLHPGQPDLDSEIFRRARSVPAAPMTQAGYGRYHLGRRRIPVAAFVFAVLLFPFGLLFLLLRTGTSLELTLIEGARPVLRIVGIAERHTWRRLSHALAPLCAPTAVPDNLATTWRPLTAAG